MIDEQELEALQQVLTEYGKAHRSQKASERCPRIIEQIDASRYSHVIQVTLNDLQKVLYKHRMEPYMIPNDKTFLADLSLLSALCERGVTYQLEDLQAILSLVIPFFQSWFLMGYCSSAAQLSFLHLLRSFVPALQQQELLDNCRSACETLYASVHLWGNFEPLREAYHLRQQFEELLFADNAPGLIFQLRRYAREDAPASEEQAKALRATLLQEQQGEQHLFTLDHPAFALLRQASPDLKKRMILAALQEGILLDTRQGTVLISAERTVKVFLADDLSWTDAEIQSILNSIGQVGDLSSPNTIIIALLQHALALLKASGKAFHNEKNLLALDEKLSQITLGYRNDRLHELHQSLADMLSAGEARGLTALLHAYQENGQGPEEEQVHALLEAYGREFGDFPPPLDHPLLQLMEHTLSASLKVRVISVLLLCRSLAERDLNLVTALSSTPLACSEEEVRALLQSCVLFYSNQDLRNLHNYPPALDHRTQELFLQWGISIAAALRAIALCLEHSAIRVAVQEELQTLYTWSQEAEYTGYFVTGTRETYDLRLLIADLCYPEHTPGLAPLLRDDAVRATLSEEEHARAVFAAYHQELRGVDHYQSYVSKLISQQASERLKAHLVREALQDIYAAALDAPDYRGRSVRYDQNVRLIQDIFAYDLPYSYEDLYGIVVSIAHLFRQEEEYRRNFQYGSQAIPFFRLFQACISSLKPSELEHLCQNELALLYAHLSHFRWNDIQQDENQLRLLIRGLLFPQSAGPWQDFLQDSSLHFTSDDEIRALLAVYHEELGAGTPHRSHEKYTSPLRERLSTASIVRLLSLSAEEIHSIQPGPDPAPWNSDVPQVSQDLLLIQTFFDKKLPFTPADIHLLLYGLRGVSDSVFFLTPYVKNLEPWLRQPDVLAQCRAEIVWLLDQTKNSSSNADVRRFHLLLCDLLSERQQQFSYPLLPDRWGTAILDELTELTPEQRDPWLAILNLCMRAKGTAPTDIWLEQARPLVEAMGTEQLTSTLRRWIDLFSSQREGYMEGDNSDILRGLIWLCCGNSDRGLAATLADAAIEGYRKLPKEGPRCPKVGDAGVFTLATMPGKDAISQLERVRRNVKQPSFQEKIGKTLDTVARREKMSREDMEELMLPTFDLQDGQVQIAVGEWTAQVRAGGRKGEPRWLDASGQPHTTLPAAFKREHKEEIKTLKRLADDMDHLINSQRDRLERMYLNERHWSLEDWRERYLEHPLLSVLARRLIWQISFGTHNWHVIWQQGQMVNAQGQPCELPAQGEVTLWHPLMSDPQEARSWQLWLEEQQITQPFKQAHREIYPITDAEQATRYYSRRFADHFIRQHQFNALARARDWHFSLHSDFSGSIQNDPAYIEIPSVGVRVEFTLSDPYHGQEIPRYLLTDQVRFQPITSPFFNTQFRPLEEIPSLVFSEVMRDVDLFVSVTSAGTDIDDNDATGPIAAYWQSYNQETLSLQIGERRQILERLIPRLAISERCSLEKGFLIVRGDLRIYRIHLISGNISMEPGNQYLCIVFDAQTREKEEERFFLPFEGDPMLSLILSKAFLLAEDSKIKDKSILNQIRR